jgi:hypothetical protein
VKKIKLPLGVGMALNVNLLTYFMYYGVWLFGLPAYPYLMVQQAALIVLAATFSPSAPDAIGKMWERMTFYGAITGYLVFNCLFMLLWPAGR